MSERIKISFVGDMSFGDSLLCQGFGVCSVSRQKGANFLFAEVKNLLKQSDIVFGNLEGILSRHGENPNSLKSVDMRGDPECAYSLKQAGFTVLNIANNHIMQHGLMPFRETVELLQSLDIQVAGLRDENRWHSRPVILDKSGHKIGIIGYAFEKDKYYDEVLPYAFGTDDLIIRDIEKLRPLVDTLIVSAHWGLERMDRPSAATIRLAHQIVEQGADMIVGHHPHVLQGIEYYKGKLIAYSLGNFIFDIGGWNSDYRESVILDVSFYPAHKAEIEIVPVTINSSWQAVPVHGNEKIRRLKYIDELSSKVKLETEGTVEENALKYYREYMENTRKNRIGAYCYFISQFGRYKKRFVFQQLARTLNSRLEDIGILKKSD